MNAFERIQLHSRGGSHPSPCQSWPKSAFLCSVYLLMGLLIGCGADPATEQAAPAGASVADTATSGSDAATSSTAAEPTASESTDDTMVDRAADSSEDATATESESAAVATTQNDDEKKPTETTATDDEAVTDEETTQVDEQSRYEFREIHDPNGIGKFYMGREIAHVMGFQGAAWLERSEREEEERLSLLMKALDLQPGQVVADIGAGSGVITLLMAERVGPEGKILAVDVQQEMLDLLSDKLKEHNIENVELVKGTEKSPKLEPESIDLALMVDVYHEFAFPYEMVTELSRALKPGGAIVWVEYRLEDPEVPIKLVHKMSIEQVKKEASQPEFNLRYRETIDILPRQHIIIFERDDGTSGETIDDDVDEEDELPADRS